MARYNEGELASISEETDVAAHILAKHSRSSQPESKQICVVLGAVTEVLKDEGYSPTPTAYFAAVMSLLEKPETQELHQVSAAMCNILTAVLARTPKGALRSKFAASVQILMRVAEQHLAEASVMKAAITCLGQVTAAVDPSQWPGAVRPFGLLLQLLLDERPKVRKRAQDAAQSVLAALQDTSARQPASDAVLKMCQQILPGPEAAARLAAQASGKQRKEAEAQIEKATADALHLLGWLRMALPILQAGTAQEIAGLVVKLFAHRHPLLSRCATDALAGLCSASSSLPAPALVELLRVIAQSDSAWEVQDQPALVSLIDLIESACMRLHEVDSRLAGERLPAAFHALVPLLHAESDGVRFASEQALKRLLTVCFTDELVAASAMQIASGRSSAPPAAAAAVAAVCGVLGSSTPNTWSSALSVSGSLFERLGSRGAQLAQPLVERVGALCAEAAEAEAEREEGEEGSPYESAVAGAMGAAIRHLGPQQVLAVLPLNIAEELEGRAKARTWLLPLLRQHARNCQLMYWCTALLPLARQMGSLAAAGGASMRAMQCRALEAQLWASLPAFASYPTDMPEAFRANARDIGSAFQNREDLRTPICAALIRMCSQNRLILQASGVAQSMGLARQVVSAESDDDEDELAGSGSAPANYTADTAMKNVEALQAISKNWLPLLFTAFLSTKTGQRGMISSTIAAYAAISDQSLLTGLFHTTLKKFLKVTQDALADVPATDALTEGGDTPSEQRCTFLELALALAGSLDTAAIGMLYKAVKPALQERDQAVQKRAYKILAFICSARRDFTVPHLKEVLETLLSGVTSSLSAAKRYRLQCLQACHKRRASCSASATGSRRPAVDLIGDEAAMIKKELRKQVVAALASVLLLLAPNAPAVDLGGDEASPMSEDEQRKQVVASLVGEIVLCVKEVNQKTRAAAYGLLVDMGQAMQDAHPPPMPNLDAHMAGMELQGSSTGKGGLALLFEMVLGGLVGTSPHMTSASVMALARLLHQFANELGGVAPALLPAVLSLLRTKSREIVKSVLGFVKVCAMRLPTEVLDQHLRPILEGLLLWSEDSKNKFKLKVRVIVERLARRCSYDAVAAAMPEGDRRLLSHIQKEMIRKKRTQSKAGSQMDMDMEEEPEARTVFTRQGATTMGGWNHSKVFSEAASQGATLRTAGRQTARAARTARAGAGAPSRAGTRQASGQQSMLVASDSGDPVDMLDARTASHKQRTSLPALQKADTADFSRNSEGRMIFNEEDVKKGPKPKRRPGGGFDDRASDDSDFDDLRQIGGLRRGMQSASAKSVALADTIATKARTARTARTGAGSARSMAGRSSTGKSTAKGTAHSGDRFRAKSKSGGDVKGSSKVEPYAYWPLDRKMLNRRSAKQTSAKRGLDQVVNAAKAGASKGRKTKRQRAQ